MVVQNSYLVICSVSRRTIRGTISRFALHAVAVKELLGEVDDVRSICKNNLVLAAVVSMPEGSNSCLVR